MRTIATLTAALTLAVAGCGGDEESSSGDGAAATSTPAKTAAPAGGGGETLSLSAAADGSLAFDATELSARAGTVTIDLNNPSSTPHAVAIEGDGAEAASETVASGNSSVTADLAAGDYTFYCPVGDHRAGGMEGTLTVK